MALSLALAPHPSGVNTALDTLVLWGNNIELNGAKALADALTLADHEQFSLDLSCASLLPSGPRITFHTSNRTPQRMEGTLYTEHAGGIQQENTHNQPLRIHTTYGIACIWHDQQMHCNDPQTLLSFVNRVFCTQEGRKKVHTGGCALIF